MIAALPLAGLLLLVAGLCLRPMQETDLFFRLAMGAETLRTGAPPRRNLFSFTYPDHPYLDPAWLFDAGVAALERAGGIEAVVLAKTAVVLGAFALAYAACRRGGAGPTAAALALAAAALCAEERLVERPHAVSFLGEALVLAALAAGGRRPWALPAATVVWVNFHAGAFAGPLLVGLAAAGAALDRAPEARRLALVAAACAAALFVTPVGAGLFEYLRFHGDIFAVHPVDEFRRPDWTSDAPLLAFALAALALVLAARRLVPLRWRELLPVAGLALLAARSVRFGADFAIVAAPLVAIRLEAVARGTPALLVLLERRAAVVRAAAGLVLAALAAAPRVAEARAGRPALAIGLDTGALPLEALRFVERLGLGERMYNDFETGGYLAWRGWPRHRVFVDARLPAYPLAFHRLLGREDVGRAEWDTALARHGVQSALLGYAGINRRVAWWDPARWALVYRENDARVFVRRGAGFEAVIAAHEIPATFRFDARTGTETVPLEAPPPGSPVPDCEWQRRLGDLLFDLDGGRPARAHAAYARALAVPGCLAPDREAEAAAWLGALELGAGRAARALALLERARALTAGDLATLTNRALALEALGRAAEARGAWAEVAARAGDTPLGARARARAGPAAAPR